MPTTMDLLKAALEKRKAAHWCKDLHLDPTALTQAKKRGHLSPAIAASIAMMLGADPMKWAAISGIEADTNKNLRDSLMKNPAIWTNQVEQDGENKGLSLAKFDIHH